MMVWFRAFGLDQWVASILRHASLGLVVKNDKNPQSCDGRLYLWWWALVLFGLINGSPASGSLSLRSWRWCKERRKPSVLWWKLVCHQVETPRRLKIVDCFDCRVVISESGRLKASSTLVWEILCSVLSQRDISSRSQAGVCVMICLIKTILGNRDWPGFPRGHAKGAHTHDDWESDVPCLSFSLSS